MKLAMSGVAVAVLLAMAPAASIAAPHERNVNARQHHQQHRIHEGVRQGDLTSAETRRLQSEARDIRIKEREYRADGRLTRPERQDLHRDLNHLSRDIHHERHDGERRHFARTSPAFHGGGHYDRGHGYGHRPPVHYGVPAHRGGASIDQRQQQQRERIAQGIRSGELTRAEANRLMAEQREVRREERAYRADGVLTHAERAELHRELNEASRHIYNETHDAQRRY